MSDLKSPSDAPPGSIVWAREVSRSLLKDRGNLEIMLTKALKEAYLLGWNDHHEFALGVKPNARD